MPDSPDNDSHATPPSETNDLQEAIRARALHTIARDEQMRKRSPRQRIVAVLLMMAALAGFLFAVDIGVRTTHRIIDLWLQIREQAQQPDVKQPFPVTVEPASPAPDSSSSSSSAKQAP